MCYPSLGGARGCWGLALSLGVLSLRLVLRPALQGGIHVLYARIGYQHPHPQRSRFWFWAAPHLPQTLQPLHCSCKGI